MNKMEKLLLEQLGFKDADTGNRIGNSQNKSELIYHRVWRKYTLQFQDKSFIEIIRLIHSIANNDLELSYAGYTIEIYLDNNILMGGVYDEQEYNGKYKDERDMAQFTSKPLGEALQWIEDALQTNESEDIDDLPFPETVEIELGDLKELIACIDNTRMHTTDLFSQALKRVNKVIKKNSVESKPEFY